MENNFSFVVVVMMIRDMYVGTLVGEKEQCGFVWGGVYRGQQDDTGRGRGTSNKGRKGYVRRGKKKKKVVVCENALLSLLLAPFSLPPHQCNRAVHVLDN